MIHITRVDSLDFLVNTSGHGQSAGKIQELGFFQDLKIMKLL
jgi:hypothetical protein